MALVILDAQDVILVVVSVGIPAVMDAPDALVVAAVLVAVIALAAVQTLVPLDVQENVIVDAQAVVLVVVVVV